MRRLVSLAVLIVVVLGSPLLSSAGVEPSPFYTVRPDLDALRARFTRVEGTYAAYPELLALATRVSASVPLIHAGALEPWVTDPLRVQGLGIINHITSMLDASAPPPDMAARLLTVADRLSDVLTRSGVTPPTYTPQALRAAGHVSQGLGWNDEVVHIRRPNAVSFDILLRLTAAPLDFGSETPQAVTEGIGALERIAAVIFASQPEPPKAIAQAFDVMDRVSSVLGAPQVGAPDVAEDSLRILERIAAVIFAPQPEPPRVASTFDIWERISAVLFAPQPEPPKVAQGLNVMDRISAVLFAPQPDPPIQPYAGLSAFGQDVISVVFNVAGTAEWAERNGLSGDQIPAMTGLTQLSKHLVSAVSANNAERAVAQLGAMLEISQAYVY